MPHDNAVRAHLNAAYKPEKPTAQEYMAKYPQVYPTFERFTHEALKAGRERVGAKMIAERMRWETFITGGEYRVNNTYVAAMARRFMDENPLYGKVFETRERH